MRLIVGMKRLGPWKRVLGSNILRRSIYSVTGKWVPEFNDTTRAEVEKYWKQQLNEWHEQKRQEKSEREKYYVLSMFPYPSGKLHMGHVRVYAISDTMARYTALCGKHVIHPMGWDAFGLPAENAAIERGELPHVWTHSNIATMRQQMDDLGFNFDWDRGFATCDPTYYKWTQYIFLKMYEAGLVYQKEAPVNWDPVDMTVLANEQIDDEGKSWRSGATVEKKFLKQWYIRTEAYAKSLYDGLEDVDPEMWKDVIALQRHWIGKPDGTRIEFPVTDPEGRSLDPLSVFSREAGCIYGASHILLSPEHPLSHSKYHVQAEKNTYMPLAIRACHPLSGENIPVFVAPGGVLDPDMDSKLGIPSVNPKSAELADELGLSYHHVVDGEGRMINSQQLNGLSPSEAFTEVTKELKARGFGGHMTSGKCGDWLVSRQRYWGTPIPMMHCEKYGTQPIPFEDLPVELPQITELTGKGDSPLAQAEEWTKVKCPNCDCGSYGLRETDTMDTFVDSSWYFLRYLSPGNDTLPFDRKDAFRLMPVDLYIGGKEHAVLHLYFARFFMHFLFDAGLVPCREPFDKLLTQGMVMGRSYRTQAGQYVTPDTAVQTGEKHVHTDTGEELVTDWEKMSKSKYNGVDPEDVVRRYGPEATRLCILANVAPKSDRKWDEEVFQGVHRWQSRMWSLVTEHIHHKQNRNHGDQVSVDELRQLEEDVFEVRNMVVKDVSFCLDSTFLLNTAISHLQRLTTELRKLSVSPSVHSTDQYERALADLLIMTAPFAPHFVSELWAGFASVRTGMRSEEYDWEKTVLDQQWPKVDSSYKLSLKVKKDGKYNVFQVKLPMAPAEATSLTKLEALDFAVHHPSFEKYFGHMDSIDLEAVQLDFKPKVRATLVIQTKQKKKAKRKKKQAKAA